jgi:hypothetical protein
MPEPAGATAATAPPRPGSTPEGVARFLPAGAIATLPNRALLAHAVGAPAWNGDVLGWRFRLLVRGLWTCLQARWVAVQRFDLRLAVARWRREPDGTALVHLDGLWLHYGRRGMALLVACPEGPVPHAVPLGDLADLGELVLASQADPLQPPWTCPPDCPAVSPAPCVTPLRPRQAR